jgi:uncharacterized phage-associated protein
MIDCLNASRYFIMRAYEDRMEATITNMKVQKLLYYSQSLHLALYNEPLFDEEIQAWRYGPVCPPAYRFYCEFEAKQLPIPDKTTIENFDFEQKKLLEEVWEFFGSYHAFSLSDMTHEEFPWKKARKNLPPDARSIEPIPHSDLKTLGYQKLDFIERENPLYQPMMMEVLKDELTVESSNPIGKGEVRDWLNSLLD